MSRARTSAAAPPLAGVVLAAGESKRFRSATPKVLHDFCGKPMLAWVLHAVAAAKPARTIVVVGRAADEIRARTPQLADGRDVEFAVQAAPLGTGDAVRAAGDVLFEFDGDVLVVPGDSPLVTGRTLRSLVAMHRRKDAAATILTAEVENPYGYGRVLRDGRGRVHRIVEETDATAGERALREVNTGVYVFDAVTLRSAAAKLQRANKQGELYLTDVIGILVEQGERVEAMACPDPAEATGINSRAQLAAASAAVRARTADALMAAGVTIVDPSQTYIDPEVRIGRDSIVHPLTFLTGDTKIGNGCEIGPSVRARDSRIDDGARVSFSVLDGARVGAEATVGPFAYLRPGARLGRRSKVGTYVEVKGSTIGEGSKVPHLSYVGDAGIGRDVNVGAGTITVNYDAETRIKSKTVVGDGAKIGSDTMLVAPVRVGKRAVTGAGSVVTRDVPAETVVVGAPARRLRKRKAEGAS